MRKSRKIIKKCPYCNKNLIVKVTRFSSIWGKIESFKVLGSKEDKNCLHFLDQYNKLNRS